MGDRSRDAERGGGGDDVVDRPGVITDRLRRPLRNRAVNRDPAGMAGRDSVNVSCSYQETLQRHSCLRHSNIETSGHRDR